MSGREKKDKRDKKEKKERKSKSSGNLSLSSSGSSSSSGGSSSSSRSGSTSKSSSAPGLPPPHPMAIPGFKPRSFPFRSFGGNGTQGMQVPSSPLPGGISSNVGPGACKWPPGVYTPSSTPTHQFPRGSTEAYLAQYGAYAGHYTPFPQPSPPQVPGMSGWPGSSSSWPGSSSGWPGSSSGSRSSSSGSRPSSSGSRPSGRGAEKPPPSPTKPPRVPGLFGGGKNFFKKSKTKTSTLPELPVDPSGRVKMKPLICRFCSPPVTFPSKETLETHIERYHPNYSTRRRSFGGRQSQRGESGSIDALKFFQKKHGGSGK